jgi:serine/threonine protein kinase
VNRADEEVIISQRSDSATAPTITIGKYTHARHHGDGLFSIVYRAQKPVDGEHQSICHPEHTSLVALKVTTPSIMGEPHDSEREARILAACSHPHIMSLIETFWQAGGRFVLVFPFLTYDLATLLHTGRLAERQIISHMRDLFDGLGYLHSKGIIHRDVKPSNILMATRDGPAYLADFGIAWSSTDGASEPAHNKMTDVGTTCYRPPELLFGNAAYTEALDLWAAGCVVAECLSEPHKTLFDAGDVGSELALIQSIFMTLGTPTTRVWPVSTFHRYESPA